MSQKGGLAQALLNDPRVLLLDEPTAGLDPLARHQFLEFIRSLARDRGVTVLFSKGQGRPQAPRRMSTHRRIREGAVNTRYQRVKRW